MSGNDGKGVSTLREEATGENTDSATGQSPLPSFELTEWGLADKFWLHHRRTDPIRYVWEEGLFVYWDGRVWQRDRTGFVPQKFAQEIGAELQAEAAEAEVRAETSEGDDAKRWSAIAASLTGWWKRARSRAGTDACLAMFRGFPDITISTTTLDSHGDLMTLLNGTLDLVTSKLRTPDPDDLITVLLEFNYDPGASAPYFEKFIVTVLPDPEVRGFVQEFAGRCLLHNTERRPLLIAFGTGRNGKTTLAEAIRLIVEPYSVAADVATFLEKKNDRIENDLARMKAARFVYVRELPEGRRLDEALIKQLTGGDTITARFLRREYFDYKPGFALWLQSNEHPSVGEGIAMEDRVFVVPFTVTIAPKDEDKTLPLRFAAERSGVLNWVIRGLRQWRWNGLKPPTAVTEFTAAVRDEQIPFRRFIEECIDVVPDSGRYLQVSRAYIVYSEWARRCGFRPCSKVWFGRKMSLEEHMSRRFGKTNDYGFADVKVKSEWITVLRDGLAREGLPVGDLASEEGRGGSTADPASPGPTKDPGSEYEP